MECLEGMNLRQYLRQRGKAPPDQAVAFMVQDCRTVAEAHALGIVHRDIKPSNLFLC
jgi:serine/threonine protein kinase